MLLDPFLAGLKESGAEAELYYARDLVIFPCCGNLNCTVRTPGKCMACDDMRWLREKIGDADVLVLASPLYFNGRTGPDGATPSLKLLLDRLAVDQHISADRPYEHAVHTTREPANLRKVVLVSGSGFVEIDGFNPVLTHLKAFCHNAFPELAGSVTGSHRVSVREMPENLSAAEIVAVACAAGRGLAGDLRNPRATAAAPLACDGGKRTAGMRREWEAVTLFEFGVIH
jgi:multimeric flavodoxin WrbA